MPWPPAQAAWGKEFVLCRFWNLTMTREEKGSVGSSLRETTARQPGNKASTILLLLRGLGERNLSVGQLWERGKMCHYSRPWVSSDAEVIFPFLFWFIYKWIEVWSKTQYHAAFKIRADLCFVHVWNLLVWSPPGPPRGVGFVFGTGCFFWFKLVSSSSLLLPFPLAFSAPLP